MRILIIACIIVGAIIAGVLLYPAYIVSIVNETQSDLTGFQINGGGVNVNVPTILAGEQSVQSFTIQQDGTLILTGTFEGRSIVGTIDPYVTHGLRVHKIVRVEVDGGIKVDK